LVVTHGIRRSPVRLLAGAALLAALVSPAASSAGTGIQRIHGGRVIQDFQPHHATAGTRAFAAAPTTTVTHFSTTVQDGTKKFTDVMVGKNPLVKLTSPSATIKTYLIPLKVVLSNHDTFDPTVHGSCDTVSAETRTMQSPIVLSQAYSQNGTAVGTGQYTDIFRREEFFSQTGPTGINPGYHVKLSFVTLPVQTLNVPAADSAEFATATACGERTAAFEINWFDKQLTSTVLPSLTSQGVTVKTFPVFLLRDVVGYDTTTNNCCILGYHGVTQTGAGRQTYGVVDYESSKRFSDALDVNTMAHEVAEWQDDPFGTNPTKPWGHTGQVTGCQGNLEVGDPLSGNSVPVTTGGHLYHPQELAFFSWFYHQSPSLGVNGLYSNNGTFTAPAAPCH
jgi:hypothetical protein